MRVAHEPPDRPRSERAKLLLDRLEAVVERLEQTEDRIDRRQRPFGDGRREWKRSA